MGLLSRTVRLVRPAVSAGLLGILLCAASAFAFPPSARAILIANPHEDRELRGSLSRLVSSQDGLFGIAVVNLMDGRTVSISADTPFPTASMYKLLVMYRVFQLIERGDLSLDNHVEVTASDLAQEEPDGGLARGETPTIRDALEAMIAISSNAAASVLTRQVGGMAQVESAATEIGMVDTFQRDGELWSTPSDLAHFFVLLANRGLVSPDASLQMIGILLQQTINDRLPALLPPEAAVAHKTGEIEDVWNDGGIVYGSGGSYVIVVMSRGGTPVDEIEVEARISAIVYARYGQ